MTDDDDQSRVDEGTLSEGQDLPRRDPVVVSVGSTIRMSVALMRQFYTQPDHRSQLVEVERIIREVDGSLTLWLKNLEHVF